MYRAASRPPTTTTTTPPISIGGGGVRDGRIARHWSGGRYLGGRCNRWVGNPAATRQFDRPTQPTHARTPTERITRAARHVRRYSSTATASVQRLQRRPTTLEDCILYSLRTVRDNSFTLFVVYTRRGYILCEEIRACG